MTTPAPLETLDWVHFGIDAVSMVCLLLAIFATLYDFNHNRFRKPSFDRVLVPACIEISLLGNHTSRVVMYYTQIRYLTNQTSVYVASVALAYPSIVTRYFLLFTILPIVPFFFNYGYIFSKSVKKGWVFTTYIEVLYLRRVKMFIAISIVASAAFTLMLWKADLAQYDDWTRLILSVSSLFACAILLPVIMQLYMILPRLRKLPDKQVYISLKKGIIVITVMFILLSSYSILGLTQDIGFQRMFEPVNANDPLWVRPYTQKATTVINLVLATSGGFFSLLYLGNYSSVYQDVKMRTITKISSHRKSVLEPDE